MKLGIFGGSFDPPHIVHSIIAEAVRVEFKLDQVLWVPAYDPPHKPKHQLTPYKHRLGMVCAATEEHSSFGVSDIEKTLHRPTYTIRMLRALGRQYPHAELYLILGSDSLAQFDTWAEPDAIVQVAQLLVYPRLGQSASRAELFESLQGRVEFVKSPLMSVSSEHIRDRLLKKKSVRYLVLESVLGYISKHHLYKAYNGD